MIQPHEIGNLLWCAVNNPGWFKRGLQILKSRQTQEEYEEDQKRSPRDYQPLCEAAYRK